MNTLKTTFTTKSIELATIIREQISNEDIQVIKKICDVIIMLDNRMRSSGHITIYDKTTLKEYDIFIKSVHCLRHLNETINELLFFKEFKIEVCKESFFKAKSFFLAISAVYDFNDNSDRKHSRNISKYLLDQVFSNYKDYINDLKNTVSVIGESAIDESIALKEFSVDFAEASKVFSKIYDLFSRKQVMADKISDLENVRIKWVVQDYFLDQTRTDDSDAYRESYEEESIID